MEYTFVDHVHNYAVWAAARAVQRGFATTTNVIKKAIDSTDLRNLQYGIVFSPDTYDDYHRKTARALIAEVVRLNPQLQDRMTYGRAAKIIAIYVKTALLLRGGPESNIARVAHPPIDRILLQSAHQENGSLGLGGVNWTQLNEQDYFQIITKLRSLSPECFWALERFWDPARDDQES